MTFPGTGQFMTWETYCLRLRESVDYPPYVEDRPAIELDMALCTFGEGISGQELTAADCSTMFGRGQVQQPNRMLTVVGWWSLIYSNDWQAVLHYSPVELAWFLLKHVIACGPIGQRTRFNPCITTLAKESWVRLGRYFNDHGILEDRDFDPWALTSFQWPTLLGNFLGDPLLAVLVVQQTIFTGQLLPRLFG